MPSSLPRLERVLDALETSRMVVERHTSEVERAQAALEAEAEATRTRMAQMTLLTSPDPRVDAALASLAHHAGLRLKAELNVQERRINEHEQKVADPARERLREANQRSKSVELLVDRQRLQKAQSIREHELKASDEHSVSKFARNLL